MKKTLIGLILTIYTLTSQAQLLKPVKIDSLVTVSLPVGYVKKDTLGQELFEGNGQSGFILVIKAPNPANRTLKKEKDLNKVFKEYISKVQQSSGNGTVLNSKDTIINNVEVRDFALSTDGDQGSQMRQFRILYTKPATYTFQYMYPPERADIAKGEIKAFFASIKTASSFDGTDQYTLYGKFTGMHKGLKFALIGGAVLLIVILIIVLRRRKRKTLAV